MFFFLACMSCMLYVVCRTVVCLASSFSRNVSEMSDVYSQFFTVLPLRFDSFLSVAFFITLKNMKEYYCSFEGNEAKIGSFKSILSSCEPGRR